MSATKGQIIIVRSLAESDLGIFSAHRASARSKQRAININAGVAKRLLSERLYALGGGQLPCTCRMGGVQSSEARSLKKVHKNWRLGGRKIDGGEYGHLDSKDFVLIRSDEHNDGDADITLSFVSKAKDRVVHAGIAAIVEKELSDSMAVYSSDHASYSDLLKYCGDCDSTDEPVASPFTSPRPAHSATASAPVIPPMPREGNSATKKLPTIKEKMRQPHILEKMLQVSSDLSAPAQHKFMKTVQELAELLRQVLVATNGILKLTKDHSEQWRKVRGSGIGFVDGGLANLSMLGSAPIAARVGGYVVIPGQRDENREAFIVLKHLIDELYADSNDGVYDDSFPDIGALRDAARISVEAAGAVRLIADRSDLRWVMMHGALVNPVSRYTDVMQDGRVRHRFPNFSKAALRTLLPAKDENRKGRDRNFISVHLKQLQLLQKSKVMVCGIAEREATTSTVIKALVANLDDDAIRPLLPLPPQDWKRWFRNVVDPADNDDFEGQRITDSLLFRCVLEPGEVLRPVVIDRNEMRRAPRAWQDLIVQYPKPAVSYLQPSEWGAPIRIEVFEKDVPNFGTTASLIYHCALLLPHYAFPVGLDIADKFARIPNWMSRPVNTRTAVLALRSALDSGDSMLFNSIRHILCGSSREWLFRPGIYN